MGGDSHKPHACTTRPACSWLKLQQLASLLHLTSVVRNVDISPLRHQWQVSSLRTSTVLRGANFRTQLPLMQDAPRAAAALIDMS